MPTIGKLTVHYKKLLLMLLDLALVFLGLNLACWLYRNSWIGYDSLIEPGTALFLTALALPVFHMSGFHNQIWRFASIMQYLVLFAGTLLHAGVTGLTLIVMDQLLPVRFFLIYWMTSFILIVGSRIFYRLVANHHFTILFSKPRAALTSQKTPIIRCLIVGAGQAGSQIIRELLAERAERHPVAAIDDDPFKHNLRILGVPVVGGRNQLETVVSEYLVDEIILAIPSAPQSVLRELIRRCSELPVTLRTLPRMADLTDGQVSFNQTKHVEIEDLLGREPVFLDTEEISDYLKNQVVMVTGGGGSIGSELCRQIARFQPARLIILDIYENNAYHLQHELLVNFPELKLDVMIGSVRDRLYMEMLFERYRPRIVFHAAAHKHVPLMENSPSEAVKNNIFGTLNVARAAAQYQVEKFVLISTDKAVNPTNVMGASKRFAEMVIQTLQEQHPKTCFSAVRFGNVLGSNGSVIPLFYQQMEQQRKITVTDPEITRYFMTIPEAAGLVIQTGAIAGGGEIFVLDMGEPVRIDDLARDLIRLSGLKPDIDVEIVYSGLRPGEKMYEELYLDSEQLDRTRHEKILVMKSVCVLTGILQEIQTLQRLIRWDSADFRSLRQDLQDSFQRLLQRCDQEPRKVTDDKVRLRQPLKTAVIKPARKQDKE